MILYGATRNKYNALFIANGTIKIYGGAYHKMGPPEVTQFPLLGAIKVTRVAPSRFKLLGALWTTKLTPAHLVVYGARYTLATPSVNISGLNISEIAPTMSFANPDISYNIYPYLAADIMTITGTDLPYRIVGHDLLFDTKPAGAITLIPFNRLQLYTEEVRHLTIENLIPNRMDFSNIRMSGDFQFSLNLTGPWTDSLTVIDNFYIKAPTLPAEGSDYTKQLTVIATATPRG